MKSILTKSTFTLFKLLFLLPVIFLAIPNMACKATSASRRFDAKATTTEEIAALESEIDNTSTTPDAAIEKYNRDLRRISVPSNAAELLEVEISKYLGTNYKHGGTELSGIDCSGFVSRVFNSALGVKLPRTTVDQSKLGDAADKKELAFGDLIFFKIHGRRISHVGIYIGEGKFAHASLKIGVTVSNLEEKYYKTRYACSRRILSFENARASSDSE
ncbi:MAG: C40 family peptidase [Rhizobacter sp.]|nr:C40 family peptidase [Chlorobiales bacterium]